MPRMVEWNVNSDLSTFQPLLAIYSYKCKPWHCKFPIIESYKHGKFQLSAVVSSLSYQFLGPAESGNQVKKWYAIFECFHGPYFTIVKVSQSLDPSLSISPCMLTLNTFVLRSIAKVGYSGYLNPSVLSRSQFLEVLILVSMPRTDRGLRLLSVSNLNMSSQSRRPR